MCLYYNENENQNQNQKGEEGGPSDMTVVCGVDTGPAAWPGLAVASVTGDSEVIPVSALACVSVYGFTAASNNAN